MDHRPNRVRSSHEGLERMKVYKERRAKTVRCICILNLQHDISVFQQYIPRLKQNVKKTYFYR